MNARAILIAARALIADPTRWTQFTLARSATRERVCPLSADAVCWCAVGAIHHVAGIALFDGITAEAQAAFLLVRQVLPSIASIPATNDVGGHAATIAMFDRAIAAAPVTP